jgi:hypothetical protein
MELKCRKGNFIKLFDIYYFFSFSQWNERWFSLFPPNCLYYERPPISEAEKQLPKAALHMSGAVVSQTLRQDGDMFVFDISLVSGYSYALAARDRVVAERWRKELGEAAGAGTISKPSSDFVSGNVWSSLNILTSSLNKLTSSASKYMYFSPIDQLTFLEGTTDT